MIELVVKYIEDKGFQVDVRPGILVIRKYAKGLLFSYGWAIPKHDLRPELEQWLYEAATDRCKEIDQTIATHQFEGETDVTDQSGAIKV